MAGPGTELATAWVRLVPSMDGATNQIVKELGGIDTVKVGKSVGSKFASNIGAGIKTAATTAVAGGAAALGTALVKGLGRLNALDQANQKLLGLGHSAASVEKIMGDALASVRGTAFGMDAAATVAASAVAAGIKPGADLQRTLKLVADAATIAGTDMGSMGDIFNKVAASNKVQMNVINQLHAMGVPALSAIADYMGVTAEEATKMASSGKIDFETFQAAMENTLGGAAASSGNTFSGAMANVGAALGRVGAGLLGGIFPKLAPLFQGLTSALGPVEDKAAAIGAVIGDKLAPVFDWLTGALSGSLGQIKLAPQIIAPLTGAFLALGSSGLAPLLRMVPGLGGFAGKLALLGGPVGIAIAAFAGLVAVSPELREALGSLLGALASAGASLAPILGDVATLLSGVLVGAIQLLTPFLAGVVQAVAGLIGWFSETEWAVQGLAIVVGVAAGSWVAYKAVLAGISFVGLIAGLGKKTAAFVLSTAAKAKDLALTAAIIALYVKDFVVAAARAAAGIAVKTAAWVAQTAAMTATRVAMVAATAAQWLLNAALSANPIGLIIIAITALVAALVWFFTQTDLGREIWAGFVGFLGDAWENVVSFVTDVWNGFMGWITGVLDGFAGWWDGLWSGIGSFFSGIWDGIVAFAQGLWQAYIGWLIDIIVFLVQNWDRIWAQVGQTIANIWNGIVSGVSNAIATVRSVIMSVVGAIASWWNGMWAGIGSFFSGLWDGMVNTVRSVGSAFGSIFGGIRDTIANAFGGIVNVVKGPINAIIGLVNGAIGALNQMKVTIPDWVPLMGGKTFGVSLPKIPMLAQGATILPRPGGTMAVLAEAGRPESVVDTGLMNRALEEGLSGNGSSGMVVQGPLVQVDQMVVDSDERVDEVAQALWERGERAERARGKVNLDGAVIE
ncbi:tape measure protein [Microbacterium caowuchunii]|uniref:Tape measure protein n=1 Tax=Microbacterium caowuchunii TaxID=2614638 RepID=A0A5N0TF39_9MICO|nr:tape measure protein [Microbacterium caowuchunii]KAA9133763.1 tape measure protein [Microbacterium caowuchunii]